MRKLDVEIPPFQIAQQHTIRFTDALSEQAKKRAQALGLSLNEYLRRLVETDMKSSPSVKLSDELAKRFVTQYVQQLVEREIKRGKK